MATPKESVDITIHLTRAELLKAYCGIFDVKDLSELDEKLAPIYAQMAQMFFDSSWNVICETAPNDTPGNTFTKACKKAFLNNSCEAIKLFLDDFRTKNKKKKK